MRLEPEFVVIDLFLTLTLGFAGTGVAWWLRRRTTLSARNFYPPAAISATAFAATAAAHAWLAALVVLPFASGWVAGAVVGARWRSTDLGAGEELRNHELSRRWVWEPPPGRAEGERLYMRSQGELVHERAWPRHIDYVSMTALGDRGPRLPLGAGQHVVLFGATGAGKTTTARKLIAARTLSPPQTGASLDVQPGAGIRACSPSMKPEITFSTAAIMRARLSARSNARSRRMAI